MSFKGQTSIEFMVVLGIVMIIFIFMVIIIQQKVVQSSEFKMEAHGRRVLYTVAENINEIVSVGEGYHKCFSLPGSLFGKRNFRLLFYPDEATAYLETEDLIWSAPISTLNVSCTISPPCGVDTVGDPIDVWVSNVEGQIVLADHGPCETDWIGIT